MSPAAHRENAAVEVRVAGSSRSSLVPLDLSAEPFVAGFAASLYNLKSNASVISSFDYAYVAVGNRTHVAENGGDRVTWTYDATYQLLSERRSGTNAYANTFTYDPVGNRLTKDDGSVVTTTTYDNANRIRYSETVSGWTTYTFDADGNEWSVETPAGDLTTNTWDYENKLVQVEEPLGDVFTYTYRPAELRVDRRFHTLAQKTIGRPASGLVRI